MSDVEPGEPKYEDSDRITEHSANGAGEQGSTVAFGPNGDLVLTSGSNGFAGIQGSAPSGAGDSVALQTQGIVPALVSAAVSKGDAVEPAADGVLQPVSDGSGGTASAGPGDLKVMSDSETTDAGEVAEVLL